MLKDLSILISCSMILLSIMLTPEAQAVTGITRTFDGGIVGSIVQDCSCSGGLLIQFTSLVDKTSQNYVYQAGVTILYQNYKLFTPGSYFLSNHFPVGICLIAEEDCAPASTVPSGTLIQIGTS